MTFGAATRLENRSLGTTAAFIRKQIRRSRDDPDLCAYGGCKRRNPRLKLAFAGIELRRCSGFIVFGHSAVSIPADFRPPVSRARIRKIRCGFCHRSGKVFERPRLAPQAGHGWAVIGYFWVVGNIEGEHHPPAVDEHEVSRNTRPFSSASFVPTRPHRVCPSSHLDRAARTYASH